MLAKLKDKWKRVCAARLNKGKVPSKLFWALIGAMVRCILELYERK